MHCLASSASCLPRSLIQKCYEGNVCNFAQILELAAMKISRSPGLVCRIFDLEGKAEAASIGNEPAKKWPTGESSSGCAGALPRASALPSDGKMSQCKKNSFWKPPQSGILFVLRVSESNVIVDPRCRLRLNSVDELRYDLL